MGSARQSLTALYKEGGYISALGSETYRLAYLLARLPATYAVIHKVLSEMLYRCGPVHSLLDMGAGPGTTLLAAKALGLPINSATLLERDPGFIQLGKKLLVTDGHWICQDMTTDLKVAPHDLVMASYSLGELRERDRYKVLEKLWLLTNKILIVIEPGTKLGFETLKMVRENLIAQGGFIAAPCPHSGICPIKDWCHFSARVERTSLHRKIKDATLNYEDEKFCYVIFSKNKVDPCQARVIRHPFKGAGYINLQLCSKNGIEEKTITKKNKSQFANARKIEWGDDLK
jgi:ribosomal protein RSM22 (predicted rRNA methylase)